MGVIKSSKRDPNEELEIFADRRFCVCELRTLRNSAPGLSAEDELTSNYGSYCHHVSRVV